MGYWGRGRSRQGAAHVLLGAAAPETVSNPQIPETLPEEVLAKMHAAPKPDVPLADVHDLPNYDGLLIGFPTRCALGPRAAGCT